MDDAPQTTDAEPGAYEPPTATYLGSLHELTQAKEVGAADGTLFGGIPVGSI